MGNRRLSFPGFAAALALPVLICSQAFAGDVVCGSVSSGWNVPGGATVFSQSPGPVASVVTAVGEYRSHSMLSRGPGGWVTHATSLTPKQNGSTSPYLTPFCSSCGSSCWNPLDPNFLYHSTPGMETVSQGAIYTFLYGGGASVAYLNYQNGGANQAALNAINMTGTMAANMSWLGWQSGTDSSQTVWGYKYGANQINYGWHEYMDAENTAGGAPGINTGVICSSALAMAQHDALATVSGYTGDVRKRTYASTTITASANALFNAVHDECYNQNGPWSSVGGFFTQAYWTTIMCPGSGNATNSPCTPAADQMVNCFASGHCGNTSSPGSYNEGEWHNVVATGTSNAISPDDVSGWNMPANGTGAPVSGAGSSIWGYDVGHTVQWNGGGTLYSCWN